MVMYVNVCCLRWSRHIRRFFLIFSDTASTIERRRNYMVYISVERQRRGQDRRPQACRIFAQNGFFPGARMDAGEKAMVGIKRIVAGSVLGRLAETAKYSQGAFLRSTRSIANGSQHARRRQRIEQVISFLWLWNRFLMFLSEATIINCFPLLCSDVSILIVCIFSAACTKTIWPVFTCRTKKPIFRRSTFLTS